MFWCVHRHMEQHDELDPVGSISSADAFEKINKRRIVAMSNGTREFWVMMPINTPYMRRQREARRYMV